MSALTDILSNLPIDKLASQLGASPEDTSAAASNAITSLLGGMTHNAQDPEGEAALAKALQDHAAHGTSNVDEVDPTDGAKIVQHVLGTTPDKAAAAVAKKTGTDSNLLTQLLPVLAPIVMNQLGSKAAAPAETSGGGNLLSGLLGSLTGGGQAQGGGALAGLLGGLLGGVMGNQPAAKPAGKKPTSKAAAAEEPEEGGILGKILGSLF